MLADSHCHLTDPAFGPDLEAVLERCWSGGLGLVVVIGQSEPDAREAVALAGRDPRIRATAGVHPHDAGSWQDAAPDWLTGLLGHPTVVAVGETGLDYHYDHASRERQLAAFEAQLALAAAAGKPAVIHAREADADVAAVLRNHPGVTAILHSFSSGPALLDAALELGHYVSFSGMVTFRNWTMDDAIRRVPLDRLLLETDAPYLAPVPFRGRRNEPAHVVEVARRVALVRQTDLATVSDATTRNALRVFNLTEAQ